MALDFCIIEFAPHVCTYKHESVSVLSLYTLSTLRRTWRHVKIYIATKSRVYAVSLHVRTLHRLTCAFIIVSICIDIHSSRFLYTCMYPLSGLEYDSELRQRAMERLDIDPCVIDDRDNTAACADNEHEHGNAKNENMTTNTNTNVRTNMKANMITNTKTHAHTNSVNDKKKETISSRSQEKGFDLQTTDTRALPSSPLPSPASSPSKSCVSSSSSSLSTAVVSPSKEAPRVRVLACDIQRDLTLLKACIQKADVVFMFLFPQANQYLAPVSQ